MTQGPRIRMVCFDLGGVLIRLRKSWADVCRGAGLDVRGDSASDRAEDARSEAMAGYAVGQISHEEWVARTVKALGGLYSPEEMNRIHDAWMLDEYAGIVDLVEELHLSGLSTACLSNTNHAHWLRLLGGEYRGVSRLKAHFASHVLGCSKPDLAIYRAFERATSVAGAEVIFFDDLIVNVESARECGWTAERIDPAVETAPQMRSHLSRHGVM